MEPTDFQNRIGMRVIPIVMALAAVGMTMIRGCHEGPFGRPQVVGMTLDQETQLGTQSFQQIMSQPQTQTIDSGPLAAAVQDIAKRLEAATLNPEFLNATKLPEQRFSWQCTVVRSQEENAFCLPGGKIVVYTGILPIAGQDSGLATVLAHEIGHALAHHGAERMAQENMTQTITNAFNTSLAGTDPQTQRVVMGILGAGAKYGVLLKYSRRHESEADHLSLLLMSAAGYDPQQAVFFWKKMEEATGSGQPPEFSSTHPSHEHRVRDLVTWQPQAQALFEHAPSRAPDGPLPLGGTR